MKVPSLDNSSFKTSSKLISYGTEEVLRPTFNFAPKMVLYGVQLILVMGASQEFVSVSAPHSIDLFHKVTRRSPSNVHNDEKNHE